jgi:hypothetical protein
MRAWALAPWSNLVMAFCLDRPGCVPSVLIDDPQMLGLATGIDLLRSAAKFISLFQSELRGKHRSHCLCFICDRFNAGKPDSCPIA